MLSCFIFYFIFSNSVKLEIVYFQFRVFFVSFSLFLFTVFHAGWDESRKFLSSFPKIGERPSKRRTSHTSSSSPEHELEDVFSEWLNMTGFLCALGGVSIQKRPAARPMSANLPPSETRKVSIISAQNSNQDLQYCPVTQFCRYMLNLVCESISSSHPEDLTFKFFFPNGREFEQKLSFSWSATTKNSAPKSKSTSRR